MRKRRKKRKRQPTEEKDGEKTSDKDEDEEDKDTMLNCLWVRSQTMMEDDIRPMFAEFERFWTSPSFETRPTVIAEDVLS